MDQKYLKSVLSYNPVTGVFIWVVDKNYNAKKGQIAGYLGSDGYKRITIKRKVWLMHRMAWIFIYGSVGPDQIIDHIDRDRGNNSIANLRIVDQYQNQQNRGLNNNSKTGLKGVHFCLVTNKFRAQIQYRYKKIHLGFFEKKEDAYMAYVEKSRELHGDYSFKP